MFSDNLIREVIVKYRRTKQKFFKISDAKDVAKFVRSKLPDNSREHFLCLYLSGSHEVISYSILSTGTANTAQIHPREIFQRAVLCGAISIVIAHNHPSGLVEPSRADHKITKRLKDALALIEVRVLDHIIVASECLSFSENGWI